MDDLANYFKSSAFPSVTSKNMATDLETMIQAFNSNDVTLYYQSVDQLVAKSQVLSASEKGLANSWLSSRGATMLIQ